MSKPENKIHIGWKEWVGLPQLGLPLIKAKIDTGAKTSSLHAFDIRPCTRRGIDCVRFKVFPLQGNKDYEIECCAPVIDIRGVMSSNGHVEERYVIRSNLSIGGKGWEIELTLSNRDPLRFRMLLGRQAMGSKVLINPAQTLLLGKYSPKTLKRYYKS